MFAARILCAILLARTTTGQSDFSTSSITLESSEPMFQKTEIASFTYKKRLFRVWAFNSNRYEIPTSQWQFRYDPLLIPMTGDQGQLVVTTEQFGDSWRTSFDLVLDDEAARSLAFDSVRQAYTNIEGLLPSTVFAIPLKSMAIRIPDLTSFPPETSLLGHQPCPPETACYPFHEPLSTVRVTMSSPSRTAAGEVESLIPKCQIYFEITKIGFRGSPVLVTFQALRDSYFYTELRDKHSADYVSKFELRRILQISRQTLGKDLTAEKAEGFDSGILEQLWNRWTVVSSTELKPQNWTRTYKADQSGVDVISDALKDIFVFDKRVQKFTLNFNSAKNHGLFLFPSDGYGNKRFTESELKRYLKDNGLFIDFQSNKIIVQKLDFVKVDWTELTDPNTLSQPLITYLPFRVEKESGFIDFSSFRAKRSTSSVHRTTALGDSDYRVKQLLEDNEGLKKSLKEHKVNKVNKTLNWLKDQKTGFKILEMFQDNTARIKNLLRSAETLSISAKARLEGLNPKMQAFENKTRSKVSVITSNLSTTVEKISTLTETRLKEFNLTVTSADRINAFETKSLNEVSAITRNLSTYVEKLSMSTETKLEEMNLKVTSEMDRMDAFDTKLNEASVSTRSNLTSVEKISMSTETRLEELNLTVTSELRDKKSVSIQLFETVSKTLAENWLCKPEWKLFCTSEKCSCYFFETGIADWQKALNNCRRLDGDLASIHNDEESKFIGNMLNVDGVGVWIGLNDKTTEGSFVWTDGSPLDFTNYHPKWDTGTIEERDSNDWVSILVETGKWIDGKSLEGTGGGIRSVCQGTGGGMRSVCQKQIKIEQIRSLESFMKELSIKLPNRQIRNLVKAVEHSVCDPGWKLHCDSISCNCYFYDVSGRSWSDALSNCQSNGSNLISIHSYDEMTFVKELVGVTGECGVWIGLTKTGCEGEFAWSDGTPVDFLHWHASRPNDICNAHCGALSADRSWGNDYCETGIFESVCKKKIPKTP